MRPQPAAPTGVSVWRVPLTDAAAERALGALLDPHEAARAARWAAPDLRRRYVVAHGALRLVLAACTGRDPRALRFVTAPRGKPALTHGGPHFSLSHSDAVALIAVSWVSPVGVDVERVRPDLDVAPLARPLLPLSDRARLDALPAAQRPRAWFRAWTRLEAAAKASGAGLTERPAAPGPFQTWDLAVDDAHVGAVAALPDAEPVAWAAPADILAAPPRVSV